MCNWFSCVTTGNGKLYYFNAKQRKQIREGILTDKYGNELYPDSHSSITAFYGLDDDRVNKYEFRPLDRKFKCDTLDAKHKDSEIVNKKIRKLDFKKLAPPELIFKKIINPFTDRKAESVTKKDIALLKKWNSVGDSVGDSVRDSVGGSVWNSVRGSVWDSVRDSVGGSVWDSVTAYTSSFFNIEKWKGIKYKKGVNPFQSGIDLWERGIIPIKIGREWWLFGYKGKLLKKVKL